MCKLSAPLGVYKFMATVLITGGTGLIGQALTKELIAKGYNVIVLSRQTTHAAAKKHDSLSYAHWETKTDSPLLALFYC